MAMYDFSCYNWTEGLSALRSSRGDTMTETTDNSMMTPNVISINKLKKSSWKEE
jgi:hypothetical protein